MKTIESDHFLKPFLFFAECFQFRKSRSPWRRCYVNSLFLIEEGEGNLELQEQIIPIKPRTLVYIPAMSLHAWRSDPEQPLRFRCAYFDWKYIERPGLTHEASSIRHGGLRLIST